MVHRFPLHATPSPRRPPAALRPAFCVATVWLVMLAVGLPGGASAQASPQRPQSATPSSGAIAASHTAVVCGDDGDQADASTEDAELPLRPLDFVIAQHCIVHVDGANRRVVDLNAMRKVIEEAAEDAIVHPHFRSTRAGLQRDEEVVRKQVTVIGCTFWKVGRNRSDV